MIALAFIDLDTQILPDEVTLPLLWIGLLINLGNGFTDISSAVIGAASGYIFLWLIYWCFRIATGKEGMGYGDFKLLAVIGAWFGWKMLPLVILLSSLAAVVIGIVLIIVAKNKRDAPFPFGPYLVGSGFVALFWGDQLNRTYLDLL
jgi:leader peptidase (prepilin peptidase)/N-methyltransferase